MVRDRPTKAFDSSAVFLLSACHVCPDAQALALSLGPS